MSANILLYLFSDRQYRNSVQLFYFFFPFFASNQLTILLFFPSCVVGAPSFTLPPQPPPLPPLPPRHQHHHYHYLHLRHSHFIQRQSEYCNDAIVESYVRLYPFNILFLKLHTHTHTLHPYTPHPTRKPIS